MASPSVTYTFANSTTADASAVNTNFNDLISAMTDGTKDFSISALTTAGTATLNGAVTLGNSTSKDITFTGSLASTIPVKTTATYNFGSSTIAMLSYYLGRNSQTTRIIGSAAMAASWTFTLPPNVASAAGYTLVDSDAAGTTAWQKTDDTDAIANLSITASVATNALTIALKDAGGSDPSTTSPVRINFRSATATTGTYSTVSVTSALSVVVSSGSTLGHGDGVAQYIYVYAINNAGTVELAVSSRLFDDGSTVSTTAEGGGGAADSPSVMYSTTARSGVACRLIGRLLSTQATAGTWASAMTEIASGPCRFVPSATVAATLTNNSAVAGTLGQFKQQERLLSNKTALTSTVKVNVTTSNLILEAGDWVIGGAVGFDSGSSTTITLLDVAVSKTSATLPATDTLGVPTSGEVWIEVRPDGAATSGVQNMVVIPPFRASIASQTTFYLVAGATFATSTCSVYGSFWAWRIR